MPGANCSIVGCPVSRRYKEISIFKVPSGTNEFKLKWRRDLFNITTKDRVVDLRVATENLKQNSLTFP